PTGHQVVRTCSGIEKVSDRRCSWLTGPPPLRRDEQNIPADEAIQTPRVKIDRRAEEESQNRSGFGVAENPVGEKLAPVILKFQQTPNLVHHANGLLFLRSWAKPADKAIHWSVFGRRFANAVDDEYIQRSSVRLQIEAELCQPLEERCRCRRSIEHAKRIG